VAWSRFAVTCATGEFDFIRTYILYYGIDGWIFNIIILRSATTRPFRLQMYFRKV